jgi:hypothetical protein
MNHLKKFENFETLDKPNDLAECSGCHAKMECTTYVCLCSNCEELGWWIDPAGGVHSPDSDNSDFEDPSSGYE